MWCGSGQAVVWMLCGWSEVGKKASLCLDLKQQDSVADERSNHGTRLSVEFLARCPLVNSRIADTPRTCARRLSCASARKPDPRSGRRAQAPRPMGAIEALVVALDSIPPIPGDAIVQCVAGLAVAVFRVYRQAS